ncbi:MAG: type II secretion system F family protein [Chloroflexota bacterium]
MNYEYVAYSESGALVKGKLTAGNEEAATEMLGYAGYRTVSLKQKVPFFSSDTMASFLYQVKPTEILLLYRQLAMLLESGTSITSALDLLQLQTDNRLLQKVLKEILTEVRGGGQLSVALSHHPKIFPGVYCRLLGVGEQSGDLESVLKQVADYIEKEVTTSKETKGALMYPMITFIVSIVVVVLMIVFVLPSFTSLYASLGVGLPPTVIFMLSLSTYTRAYGLQLLLGLLAVVVAGFLYVRTATGRYNWDKMMFKIPRLGRVKHLSELSRCCRSMALLFKSGLPLTEVMPLVIQSCGNQALGRALDDVQQEMLKGEGLSKPMTKNKVFLPMMVQMVRVGEETGSLDVTLQAVAQSYEAEAQDKMHSFIALIQPTMTVFMGLIIALLALTLMSAMTSMYGGM